MFNNGFVVKRYCVGCCAYHWRRSELSSPCVNLVEPCRARALYAMCLYVVLHSVHLHGQGSNHSRPETRKALRLGHPASRLLSTSRHVVVCGLIPTWQLNGLATTGQCQRAPTPLSSQRASC